MSVLISSISFVFKISNQLRDDSRLQKPQFQFCYFRHHIFIPRWTSNQLILASFTSGLFIFLPLPVEVIRQPDTLVMLKSFLFLHCNHHQLQFHKSNLIQKCPQEFPIVTTFKCSNYFFF